MNEEKDNKILQKDDVIINKKSAIKALNKMLESLINDSSITHLKKANLISFWIKDYVKFLEFEESFDPTKNISYKRGNVVKLNFGFNVGAEYGGLHYGIVLDNNNAHNSPVVTVIPLTSIKAGKKIHTNSVDLGNELYRSLKFKYDTISKSLNDERTQIMEMLELSNTLYNLTNDSIHNTESSAVGSDEYSKHLLDAKNYLSALNKLKDSLEDKMNHNTSQTVYLEKIGNEISQMKEGSIALVNQITTVSKMRIFDPRNLKGVLSGISLAPEIMDKINCKVKELYTF